MPSSVHDQIAEANKARVENLLAIANATIASTERLAALNLDFARSLLEDSLGNVQVLMSVKDPTELAGLQASLTQPAVEKVVAYTRSVFEISNQTNQQLKQVFDDHYQENVRQVSSTLEQAGKNAPAGTESLVAAFKTAFNSANSAYEKMNKVAHQIAELTEANMSAAAQATQKAASKKPAK